MRADLALEQLSVAPCWLKDAKTWVALHHSRLKTLTGGGFAVSIEADGKRVCVAVFGRPKAWKLQVARTTGEIVRVASDGSTKHAASKAYGAIRRMALAGGYRRIVTYTHLDEPAVALKAAGFWPTAITRGGEYDRPSRRRKPVADARRKIRWEAGPDALPLDPIAADAVPNWHGERTAA